MTTSTRNLPGAHLIAQFEGSHEHFPAYHQLAMRLAEEASHDPTAATTLVSVVDRYTSHLHVHHTAEEIELFPAVVHAQPDLGEAVAELLAHHASLAELLERVHRATRRVQQADDAGRSEAVNQLVGELVDLHELVERHLAFEEATINPVIAKWTAWPF